MLSWNGDTSALPLASAPVALQVAAIKGVVAGRRHLTIGLVTGSRMPPIDRLASAVVVGFLGYGVSLTPFVLALRHLGTARTGAYFSVAPFVGAGASIVILHEPATTRLLAGGALMAAGVWLHLTERHEHDHEGLIAPPPPRARRAAPSRARARRRSPRAAHARAHA